MGSKPKSFDFVVYRPEGKNLLVDVKGRRVATGRGGKRGARGGRGTLQNWATREDIDDLRQWQEIFGEGFSAMFLFMYYWPGRVEEAPFAEMFSFQEKWYSMMAIGVEDYRAHMKTRSQAWGTVHLGVGDFRRLAKPFEEWL